MEILDKIVPFEGIEQLREIVNKRSCATFSWGANQLLVDMQTANMLCKVYDLLKPETQATLDRKMKESKGMFIGVVNRCWQCIN